MKCQICKEDLNDMGHNSFPFKRGNCCDKCNSNLITPLRLYLSGYNKKKLLVIENNKIYTTDVLDDSISIDLLQRLVNGYIEIYPYIDKNFFFIVNEDGKILKDLKHNDLAYEIFGINIFGNLVLCPKNLMKEDKENEK